MADYKAGITQKPFLTNNHSSNVNQINNDIECGQKAKTMFGAFKLKVD